MNCCRETMKMVVPRAAQALAPRAGQPQGIGPEEYLNGPSQGATPEDARKTFAGYFRAGREVRAGEGG